MNGYTNEKTFKIACILDECKLIPHIGKYRNYRDIVLAFHSIGLIEVDGYFFADAELDIDQLDELLNELREQGSLL